MAGWDKQKRLDEERLRQEASRRQAAASLNPKFPYRIRGADWEWLGLPANPRPLKSDADS